MTTLLLAALGLGACGSDKLATGGGDAAAHPDGGARPDGSSRPDATRTPDGPRRSDAARGDASHPPDGVGDGCSAAPVEGQPCAFNGAVCPNNCTDRCQFCNLFSCQGGVWTHQEVFPDPTCGRDGPGDGGSPDASRTCSAAGTATTNAPPVEISFDGLACTYTLAQVAQGVSLRYGIRITATTPDVIPLPGDAGSCDRPGPSGLSFSARIEGNGQNYCLCDTGPCQGPPLTPTTLQPGTFAGALEWMGRNWSGPSDTNNPMGAAFPPGTYTLKVSTHGLRRTPAGDVPFEVSATREILLVR